MSEREVTEALQSMLEKAREAQEAYSRVEGTMERLRGAVSSIKEMMAEVKPVGKPGSPGIWGSSGEEVGQLAMSGDAGRPDAEGGTWLRNALDNTEQELNTMHSKASKFGSA
jgi:hypothetical protein